MSLNYVLSSNESQVLIFQAFNLSYHISFDQFTIILLMRHHLYRNFSVPILASSSVSIRMSVAETLSARLLLSHLLSNWELRSIHPEKQTQQKWKVFSCF